MNNPTPPTNPEVNDPALQKAEAPESIPTPEVFIETVNKEIPQPASKEVQAPVEFPDDKNLRRLRSAINKTNTQEDRPAFGFASFDRNPYTKVSSKPTEYHLNFPTATTKHLSDNVANMIAGLQSVDEKTVDWYMGVDESLRFMNTNDSGVRALANPKANFIQTPKFNDKVLAPGVYKRPSHENKQLSTREAVFYAMAALDVGIPSTTALWSSGWWVSFRPATDDEWVALEDSLTRDKSTGLRAINGLAMSNAMALTLDTILKFAVNHIVGTNIRFEPDVTPNYLKLLLAPDIDAFLAGFLTACHPNGYPISRKCTAKIKECFATMSDNVMLSRLLVVDFDRLEERHMAHMARNSEGQITEKEIAEYQSTLPSNQAADYTIIENEMVNFKARFKVPNAEETINSGNRWSAMLSDLVRNIMSEQADESVRVRLFERQARATKLREYSHWIEELKLDTNVANTTESIEKTLEVSTPNDTARKALYTSIDDFIEHTRVAIVALPNYACPSCGGVQAHNSDKTEALSCIPLNVITTFFHLAHLRVFEIMNRE